jgi:hypothetical protein
LEEHSTGFWTSGFADVRAFVQVFIVVEMFAWRINSRITFDIIPVGFDNVE